MTSSWRVCEDFGSFPLGTTAEFMIGVDGRLFLCSAQCVSFWVCLPVFMLGSFGVLDLRAGVDSVIDVCGCLCLVLGVP